MAKLRLKRTRTYRIELNRPVGDSTRQVVRRLERKGYVVDRLPHLTTISVRRPSGRDFATFRDDIRAELQPRIGSALINSSSGRCWICSFRGNRSGRFVAYD